MTTPFLFNSFDLRNDKLEEKIRKFWAAYDGKTERVELPKATFLTKAEERFMSKVMQENALLGLPCPD